MGEPDRLLRIDHARQLDPLSLIINADEARLLCVAHQTDQAIELLQKTISLDPNFAEAHRVLALAYIQKGQNSMAIDEARRGVELDPNDYERASLGFVYGVSGKQPEARKLLAELNKTRNGQKVSGIPRLLGIHPRWAGRERSGIRSPGRCVSRPLRFTYPGAARGDLRSSSIGSATARSLAALRNTIQGRVTHNRFCGDSSERFDELKLMIASISL